MMASTEVSVQVLLKDLPQFERLILAVGHVIESRRDGVELSRALDELERAARDLARQ